MDENNPDFIAQTAAIVSAYVSHNTIVAESLPHFIGSVHLALSSAGSGNNIHPKEELTPAVSIKKSVTADYLICLEDGKKFKSLKRHLWTRYGLSPEQYREKWKLPFDYPMVAPAYAATRSALAKTAGLGRRREAESTVAPAKAAAGGAKRGRATAGRKTGH